MKSDRVRSLGDGLVMGGDTCVTHPRPGGAGGLSDQVLPSRVQGTEVGGQYMQLDVPPAAPPAPVGTIGPHAVFGSCMGKGALCGRHCCGCAGACSRAGPAERASWLCPAQSSVCHRGVSGAACTASDNSVYCYCPGQTRAMASSATVWGPCSSSCVVDTCYPRTGAGGLPGLQCVGLQQQPYPVTGGGRPVCQQTPLDSVSGPSVLGVPTLVNRV
jgi:hypothetical protein